MKLIVKKILFVSVLLLLVAPPISGQQSCLSDIESDFQDLKTSLKNLLFLDPAPDSNYDDREGKKVLMVVVHHTESPTLKSTKCALNSAGISVQLIVDRDGSITLMVPLKKRAWHAGISYAKVQVDNVVEELQKLNDQLCFLKIFYLCNFIQLYGQ